MITTANSGGKARDEYSENSHLSELGGSDYEIRDGEPDIKGWDVKNEHGQKLGEVDELLFDPQSRKVRYIILDLADNELGVDVDRKVLIPIGIAKIYNSAGEMSGGQPLPSETNSPLTEGGTITSTDEDMESLYDAGEISYHPAYDSEVVIIPADLAQLSALPSYEKAHIPPKDEIAIRRVFEGTDAVDAAAYNRHDFYAHGHFDERGYFDRGATATQIIPGSHEAPDLTDED